MSYIVIIRGPLGIGKTTVAKKIAKTLQTNYFSIDEILSKNNLDHVNEEIGCIPQENFLKANQIIIKDIFKNNQSAIIDGNFYYQQQIKNLIHNIPFKPLVFTLTAPLEICIERDSLRLKSLGVGATTAVYNLVSKFNYGEVINTKDLSIEKTVKIILSKIDR